MAEPWLPTGFSFLSGLPELQRKRRLLMADQVYTDESGPANDGRHMVMVGLLAEAEAWASFSTHWEQALAMPPRIAYFSAREAFRMKGEFYHFSESNRTKKLAQLSALLNAFQPAAVYSVVDVPAFNDVLRPVMRKPLNHPYFWLYYTMAVAACKTLLMLKRESDRFEAIFDEQKKLGPLVRRWYPLVVELLDPAEQRIMPVDPVFRSDKEFLPLQASDLLAYMLRESLDIDRPESFADVMGRVLPNVTISPHSDVLRRDRLQAIADKTVDVPPAILKRRKELLGF